MVEPASPVPFTVGARSLVSPFWATGPVVACTSSITDRMTGVCGGVMSGAAAEVVGLVLPAVSVASADRISPLILGGLSVRLKFPWLSTTTVPRVKSPSRMVTVLPASPMPLMVPPSFDTTRFPGADGGVVSTVKMIGSEAVLWFPAASVSVTVIECVPSGSGPPGVTLQVPLGSTVVVPIATPLS